MALQRTRGLSAAQVLRFAGRRSAAQDLPGGRSPLNAVPLGPRRKTLLICVAVFAGLPLTSSATAGTTNGRRPVRWQQLEREWDSYRASGSSVHAEAVYRLLPPEPLSSGGYGHSDLMEKFYSALPWLEPQLFKGDRWATRVAFRLCAVADAAFAVDLWAMLGTMIRHQPGVFLSELLMNQRSVGDVSRIVLNLERDEFLEAPPHVLKAELQARLDALTSLKLSTLELMDLRDECRSLLGEEVTHRFNGE